MLLVALTAALLLPPAGVADDPAVPAARTVLFTGQGAGHLLLDVPADTIITEVRVLGPMGSDVFGLRLNGPTAYYYIADVRGHMPYVFAYHTLPAGIYHVYAFGPPDRPFAIELVLGDLEGTASYATTPHEGRAFRLHGSVPAELAGAAGTPAAVDRATTTLEARGMVVLAEHVILAGSGATAVLGGLHVHQSALQGDCVPRPGAFGISGGFIELGAHASFVVEPGAWELGIDYAAPGSLLTVVHDSLGLAYALAPGDPGRPNADLYWGIWFGNVGLSSVPSKLQLIARSTACASLPSEVLQALAANP